MSKSLILLGDENLPSMPMKDSEVNHMRRLLAWMRVEYCLDENMQRGFLMGASEAARLGLAEPEKVSQILQEKSHQINQVPAYVRQAVKMLSKTLEQHDKKSGVVDS